MSFPTQPPASRVLNPEPRSTSPDSNPIDAAVALPLAAAESLRFGTLVAGSGSAHAHDVIVINRTMLARSILRGSSIRGSGIRHVRRLTVLIDDCTATLDRGRQWRLRTGTGDRLGRSYHSTTPKLEEQKISKIAQELQRQNAAASTNNSQTSTLNRGTSQTATAAETMAPRRAPAKKPAIGRDGKPISSEPKPSASYVFPPLPPLSS